MERRRDVALICFLLLLNSISWAQEPYAIKMDKGKGLPSNSVYDIFQDSRGFVWIANDEGLTRYDGYEFKTYTCPQQTSKSGSYIVEDKYHRIWYENFDGYLYYVENDTLRPFVQSNLTGYWHYGIGEDRVFLIRSNEVVIYDLAGLKQIHSLAFNTSVMSSSHYVNGRFCIVADKVYQVTSEGKIRAVEHERLPRGELPGNVMSGKEDGILYSGHNNGFFCYELRDTVYRKKFRLNFNAFIQSASYVDSCYWFCTPKGVYAYRENGEPLNNGEPFYRDQSISVVLKDREGNFWFGTTNNGLLFVPDLNTKAFSFGFNILKMSLCGNKLLLGTKKGQIYDVPPQTMLPRLIFDSGTNKEVGLLEYDTLSGNIFTVVDNFKMLGADGRVLKKCDVAVKSCYRINSKYLAFAASGLSGIFAPADKKYNEWDGRYRTEKCNCDFELNNLLGRARGKSVAYDGLTNTIYLATNTGLFAVNLRKKKELKHAKKKIYISKFQQFGNRIFGLSSPGRLYEIKSSGAIVESGLMPLLRGHSCENIKVADPYLFILTAKGIFCSDLSKAGSNLRKIDVSVSTADIADIGLYQNRLVLATSQGIIFTTFKNREAETAAPLFVINNLKVNDRLIDPSFNPELRYTENNVEINYAILSFKTGQDADLYYRINEGSWEKAEPESRTLRLAALAPGEYKISFCFFKPGQGAGGVKTRIFFSISKPWWQTWWALSLSGLLVLVVFIAIYKWQTGLLKKQNQLLSQKFDLEKNLRTSILKSIKAQMNPHFFYNALNTIQSFIFTDDKRSAATYLSKFSKLTRTILEMSEKETVTLTEEIEALTLYLEIEKVRFDNDFNFSIASQEELNMDLIKIPSMIIQPYVENAIRHGLLHKKGDKRLEVRFGIEKSILSVQVSDNGIGRLRSAELNRIKSSRHSSFATAANSKRLSILNKDQEKVGVEYVDKKDELGNALGTTVHIRIPLGGH